MRTGQPHTMPPGPYSDLAKEVGGVVKLAEALQVDRGTVSRAAAKGRWLTGAPGVRLKALCGSYEITVPDGMMPPWL